MPEKCFVETVLVIMTDTCFGLVMTMMFGLVMTEFDLIDQL